MRTLRVLAASFALLASQTFSQAATLSNVHIGNWLAGAYSNDQTGAFSHCAASASYRNGLQLLFSLNQQYVWSFGLASTSWSLTPGARYPISFRLDGGRELQDSAVAMNTNVVKVDLASNGALLEAFRYGSLLTVYTAGQTFQFRLTRTSTLLPSLQRCVQSYAPQQPQQGSENPFVAQQPSPPAQEAMPTQPPPTTTAALPPPQTPTVPSTLPQATPAVTTDASEDRHAEANALMTNILMQSSVSNFQVLSSEEAQKLHGDAAWRAGDSYGLININSAPHASPEDLNASVIGVDAKACHDNFFSGTMPDASGSRLFTSCRSDKQTLTVYYTTIRRPKGGYYVLATGGVEKAGITEARSARELDTGIRQAAYKVVTP